MKALFDILLKDKALTEMSRCFRRSSGKAFIYGMSGSLKHAAFAACYELAPAPSAIIVHDRQQLKEWESDLAELLPEAELAEMPVLDMTEVAAAAKSRELVSQRMDILGRLSRGEPVIILSTAEAAVQKGISRQDFEQLSIKLRAGQVLERDELLAHFVQIGYHRMEETAQVEMPGEFSVRGGIVDVYPINEITPYRIEFFDDEIESIRSFSLETQRSIKTVDRIEILPVMQENPAGLTDSFLAFMPETGKIIIDEPLRVREHIIKIGKESPELKNRILSWNGLSDGIKNGNVLYLALMLQKIHGGEPDSLEGVTSKGIASFQGQMDMLASDTEEWLAQKNRVIVLASDKSKQESLREFFAGHRLPATMELKAGGLKAGAVTVLKGSLLNGFELPGMKLTVLTEKDIFGRQKRKLTRISKEERISHFRDIKVGDYVVCLNHGIGKYMGVETHESDGVHKDYLYIMYGGGDKLYVPTDQVSVLQKYIGAEGEVPKLHRLGGSSWKKSVSRAKAAVEDIADELIKIYAARQKATGFAFDGNDELLREFEDSFPYEETPDQLSAIADIKADMAKAAPMDRLLCGDVGFGKTEVAIRAAYNAVLGGWENGRLISKQVAVLVPTTVLAQQHYKTFQERFQGTGVNIDVINRFRSAKEQRETLQRTRDGLVDILIGTHAILNQKKVQFRDLGLLIVDEEQRFGVKQKEKIKSLAAGVDCLTLSATPIPRTLHMSLTGTRDMSIIESAPADRYPVQSFVVEDDDGIIRDAIRRELKRGGQVYFVYNRVETIDYMKKRLEELVPEAVIQTAHGQMPEEMLERIMVEFYEGKYDILLATSIIENGLDLPNANTIIVYDADKFGLSQLYQMRGRVGRSSRMAYAYFVYQENKVLTETAERRLQAIKEFTELGAGFKIAMRDLEIRGAGNLLGAQQHGHIASVGFEMYCRLLEEAVQTLRTGRPPAKPLEPVIELPADAYIDGEYIEDAMHKIEVYQRMAAVRDTKQLLALEDELEDRFGVPTEPVRNLLSVMDIKNYARRLGIQLIILKNDLLELEFASENSVEPENLMNTLGVLKNSARMKKKEYTLQVKMGPKRKANLLRFVKSLVRSLAGEAGRK